MEKNMCDKIVLNLLLVNINSLRIFYFIFAVQNKESSTNLRKKQRQ